MILELSGKTPRIDASVFIAPNASIIGDVEIGSNCSVWFGAVIRGDINYIRIGEYTNIQDLSVLHVPGSSCIEIGDFNTIGHRSIIHGCRIGSNCLIGMGSIIMNDVEIGDNCVVGAGSLVTEGTKVPQGSLIFGSPAKVKRVLSATEVTGLKEAARNYYEYSRKYLV